MKFKRGEYQSKICPYGYRKSIDGRMEPDEESAAGVKLIFELAQSGLGAKQIVRAMHERGIATPAEYKAAHGFNGHDISRCHGIWQESTVARILMDERYTGTYIIGKREVTEVGGHKVKLKDESQWVKIPDHHPAIISKELYDRVQALRPKVIHTYLAGVCRVYEVPLDKVQKPKRVTSQNTRSRGRKDVDERSDVGRKASPRLHDFAAVVGIRRAEYTRLRGDDLVYDESGYLCVQVKRGKGGKFQLQRILPGDEMFVRAHFDGSASLVFTKAELDNKIDLHHLRALQAQRAYKYYADRLHKEPGYRERLEVEIKARWRLYNKRRWKQREFEGTYQLRGANRELAQRLRRPVEYDRLAVLAVSVFHLSHWRTGVTVSNYLLAY